MEDTHARSVLPGKTVCGKKATANNSVDRVTKMGQIPWQKLVTCKECRSLLYNSGRT